MTFMLKLYLDILKMYLHANNEVSIGQCFHKSEPKQDRQAHRQTQPNTLPAALAEW